MVSACLPDLRRATYWCWRDRKDSSTRYLTTHLETTYPYAAPLSTIQAAYTPVLSRSLQIFLDVASHRSFSKAAEVRGMSQPAISQAVAQLEERLGEVLIDRAKRPLDLTACGQLFYDGCRKLCDEYQAIEDEVRQLRHGRIVGRVRVASIYSVGLLQMQAYVEKFEQLYPDVKVQLEYLHPDDVYAQVRRDNADLGIVSYPRTRSDLECHDWLQQEMGVVVAPSNRLTNRLSLDLTELRDQPFVGFTPDLTIRDEIDRALLDADVEVKLVHQFDNIENIKRAVEIGAGVSILPLDSVRREVEFGLLKAIPIANTPLTRPLGIIRKRGRPPTAAVSKFRDLLLDASKEEAPVSAPRLVAGAT